MMMSNAHLFCKGMKNAWGISTLRNNVISPLSVLGVLSGQLIFVLVDQSCLLKLV